MDLFKTLFEEVSTGIRTVWQARNGYDWAVWVAFAVGGFILGFFGGMIGTAIKLAS